MSGLAALCITVGALTAVLPAQRFTLAWEHTVEKQRWEEDYIVAGDWLFLSAARIRGSGAGMEPPPEAVREGTIWRYRPADPWRRALHLARSEFGTDYELCIDGDCRPLGQWVKLPPAPTTLAPCTLPPSR
jgi:hypothetical protein